MATRQATIRTCDRCGQACDQPVTSRVDVNLALGATAAWAWVRVGPDGLDLCDPCVRGFVAWWTAAQSRHQIHVVRPPEENADE